MHLLQACVVHESPVLGNLDFDVPSVGMGVEDGVETKIALPTQSSMLVTFRVRLLLVRNAGRLLNP